jgi:hypothetical protein
MPPKRVRPLLTATINPTTEAKLREVADGRWGGISEIVDAALRAYLGLPAVKREGSRVAA